VRNRTAWLIAYRAVSDILGKGAFFLVTILAARRLSAEAFGIFALGSALGWIAAVASDFGMQLHLARAVAQQPHAAMRLLRVWLRMRTATAALALATVAVGLTLTGAAGPYALTMLLLASVYAVNGLTEFLNHFYRGLGRSDLESTLMIWQRLATLACAGAALWLIPDVTMMAAALLVPALLALAFSLRQASALAPPADTPVQPWPSLSSSSGAVLPIGAGILLSAIYFRVDVFLIELWRGPVDVGTYNAVFRIVEALRLFPAAAIAVIMPALFNATDTTPLLRSSVGVTLFAIVVSAGLWIMARPLIETLYGAAFVGAVPAFRVLLLSFPLMSLNYALTHQLIGWHGHRAFAVICLGALILNVTLNARLIPALSIVGAAWTTLWTEVLVTVGCVLALVEAGAAERLRLAGQGR
jgi:O-antigen/teichoic acid export membrane protein